MKKVLGIILTIALVFSSVYVLATDNDGVIVNASDWAMEEVSEAYDKGLIPEALEDENLTENVTRAEFAAIAVKLYENLTDEEVEVHYDQYPFYDVTGSNPYYYDISAANFLGITNGTSETTFTPDALITREQMATMVLRTLDASEINTEVTGEIIFRDSNEVSDYAKNAVQFMSGKGVINGVGDNKFEPKATATREQAILIAYRCVNEFKEDMNSETLGNILKAEFEEIADYGNAYEVAESLVTSPSVSKLNLVAMEVEEGYLTGFDDTEINGFSEGAMFSPMIGTIPFVGYVFTVDNAEYAKAFATMLEGSANPRWNICTRADETVVGTVGNKVFFVMCPATLGE